MNLLKYKRTPITILKNLLGIKQYPSFITYTITWRCNARCIMCDCWKKKNTNDELTLAEIEKIFKSLKKIDAIRITGGEPFIRDDIADIIRIIDTYVSPKIIHITTNGMLKDKILKLIHGLDKQILKKVHMKISIDAVGEKHDDVRGVPGAYEKAYRTIKEVSALSKEYGFVVGVNQTIVNRESFEDYKNLKEICKSFGINLFVVLAYKSSAMYAAEDNIVKLPSNSVGYDLFFDEFSKEEIEKIISIFQTDSEKIEDKIERIVKNYYLTGIKNRLQKNICKPNPRCLALRSHLRIFPNGDVPVCLFDSRVAGNLKEESFKDLWFSKELTDQFRKTASKCKGCYAECEIIPNAIYSGDIIRGI